MAQSFDLNQDALDKFTKEMFDLHESVGKHVEHARGNADMLAGGLRGPAGDALQRTFEQFLTAAKRMNDSLYQNAENLDTVNSKYGDVEMEQLDELNKVGNTLNI